MKSAFSAYSTVMTSARRITAVGTGLIVLAVSLASCGSDSGDDGDGPAEGAIAMTDANAFTATAALTLGPPVDIAATGSVCWDAPQDLLCHDADPVKTLFLLRVLEPNKDEVLRLLVKGELDAHIERTLRYTVTADDTDGCAGLAEFKVGEAAIDINAEFFASTAHSYLLVYSSAEAAKQGTLSMTFLEPGAGTTPVQSPTGCGQLNYTIELETLTPVVLPAAGPWLVDWRGLTRTGDGGNVPFSSIDRAMLAFYPGRTLPDLEMNVFDLEQLEGATYWEIPLTGGRDTDLSLAKERVSGAPFPGFTTAAAGATGIWLLALMCDTCASPAPVMLTVLSPTG